jgi:hypothetical protein
MKQSYEAIIWFVRLLPFRLCVARLRVPGVGVRGYIAHVPGALRCTSTSF